MSYGLGKAASGATGWRGAMVGASGVAQAGAASVSGAAGRFADKAFGSPHTAYAGGADAAFSATGGARSGGGSMGDAASASSVAGGAPGWAQKLRREQFVRDATMAGAQTVKDGDRPVGGESPRLRDDE